MIPYATQEEMRQKWCKHEQVKDAPERAKCPECGIWVEIFGERIEADEEHA